MQAKRNRVPRKGPFFEFGRHYRRADEIETFFNWNWLAPSHKATALRGLARALQELFVAKTLCEARGLRLLREWLSPCQRDLSIRK